MLSLHQLRCFVTAYEYGSFTAAAQQLGYSQPSLSEQIKLLERTLGVQLFRRVGRGVIATGAADALRPHAEGMLAGEDEARRAVAAVNSLESGTIRFGIFGSSRLYIGASLIADVLTRHPGVRFELVGQNSAEVQEDLRRGWLEAAMIAIPVADEGMTVRPVAREELVYISADPEQLRSPVTPRQLAEASLVLPETSWRGSDSSRRLIAATIQRVGGAMETRIEVEDVETAVELVAGGFADSVVPKAAFEVLRPTLAPKVGYVSLRPRLYDTMAIVHRKGAVLSPPTRLVIELATARMQAVTEPLPQR
jgi:DNA-binding transcriptional LysR family regulator